MVGRLGSIVADGVLVLVGVRVLVSVFVGVKVAVSVKVAVGVSEGVTVEVCVLDGTLVEVGCSVSEGIGVSDGVTVGVSDGNTIKVACTGVAGLKAVGGRIVFVYISAISTHIMIVSNVKTRVMMLYRPLERFIASPHYHRTGATRGQNLCQVTRYTSQPHAHSGISQFWRSFPGFAAKVRTPFSLIWHVFPG